MCIKVGHLCRNSLKPEPRSIVSLSVWIAGTTRSLERTSSPYVRLNGVLFSGEYKTRRIPSALGRLVRECWVAIPLHFPQVELHEFVVMPNHLHGLIAIVRKPTAPPAPAAAPTPLVGAQHRCALPPGGLGQAAVVPGSIGAIVRSFKSIVVKRAHKELGWNGPIWQRNYFERVLRDGKEFADASRYIAENPKKWEWDRENPEFKTR